MSVANYDRVNWEDAPSKETPLNAANLNNMDAGIEGVAEELENVKSSMSSIDDRFDLLEARMDTLVAVPPGSTTENTELLDIRLGADGTTYNAAGAAVRGQIEDLNSAVDAVEDNIDDVLTMIVPVFSPGVYNKGDLVRYENDLYECISKTTSGAAWDSTKWSSINLASLNRYLHDYIAKPYASGGTVQLYDAGALCFYDHKLYRSLEAMSVLPSTPFDSTKWEQVSVGRILTELSEGVDGLQGDVATAKSDLVDLTRLIIDKTTTSKETNLIPSIPTTLPTNWNTGQSYYYVSDRVIPEGALIKSVKIGTNVANNGSIIFVNDENVVVYKYPASCVTGEWNVFEIGAVANEDLRIAVYARASWMSSGVTADNAFASNGLWLSDQLTADVGDTMTFAQGSSSLYELAVQWEIETGAGVVDAVSSLVEDVDELKDDTADLNGAVEDYACWFAGDILEVTEDDLESGTWRYSEKLPDTKILRYNKLIPVRKGMTFKCINPTYSVIYALLETKTSASALELVTTAAGVNRTATIGYDGYMALIISSVSDISVSDYDCDISVTKKSVVIVDDSLTIAGEAADAKATGDALGDLREYVDAEINVESKTELIPNVSSDLSSYSGPTNTDWYLSDRVIPTGSVIKSVKIGSKQDYNYGAILVIDSDNVIVQKYVQRCEANKWTTFDINLTATKDYRLAVSATVGFTTTDVPDDEAFATNGLWSLKQPVVTNVGDTVAFTQVSPYKFRLAVQWEIETLGGKISDVVAEHDDVIKDIQRDVDQLLDDMDAFVDSSLTVAGKAADAKATGDALYDLAETIHTETSIKTKTEFIPNIANTLSSYSANANADWYLSNRVIPEGSVIKSVKIGARAAVNNGSIIFINDNDVVVRKYTVSCDANDWNTVELDLLVEENLRLAVSAAIAYTTANVSNDAAIATDGLWSSKQGSVAVGDTLTYSKAGPYLYMFAVQWEVETYGKISDSIITVKDKRPESGYHNFSVPVNYHEFTDNTADGETLYTDYGVVALPTNYSPTGNPTKLIILCGGAGERIEAATNPLSFHGWAYYLAKGYAVMDMNGISVAWATAMGFPRTSWHYCNKYLIDSYHKGYEYVLNKYNIDRTKVLIAGISMGGGASALLVQSGIFPVVAHCGFCPALSVYKQDYMNAWHGDTQQKTIAGMYGFANWSSTATFDQAYFLANISKISGFDNLTIRAIGDIDTANAHYGDADEATAYNSIQKIYPVPVKIWHSVDDPTVLVRYSEFFVTMIKNGGGQAWLRTFPSGAHVGGWSYGSVSDTDIDGNTVTTSIPFYESVLFFKRFG